MTLAVRQRNTVSIPTTKRDTLGRFLRLAEFGGATTFAELYRNAGGTDVDRDAFLREIVRKGYCALGDDDTVQVTGLGLQYSRRRIRG